MNTVYILVALAIGVGAALQTSMIGSLGRTRGATEAAWISLLATVTGLALVFAVRSLRGSPPALPSPLDNAGVFGVVALAGALAMAVSMRGLEPWLAMTGLFGFVGSSRVDLQACKLEYSIVSPK